LKLKHRHPSCRRDPVMGAFRWKLAPLSLATLLLQTAALAQQAAGAEEPKKEDAPQASAEAKPATPVLQQVVITSEKRSSTVFKTPLSVTAVTGDEIADRGANSVNDLIRGMPGVAVKGGGPGKSELVLRGLASSGGVSPTVGFYLNEIPVTTPSQASLGHTGVDPDLYDLERVEVLRGPQGTLYGASSLGGTVRLITTPPSLRNFLGSAQLQVLTTEGGGFSTGASGMLNMPLEKDVAALRVVATRKHDSGWIDRVVVPHFPLPTVPDPVLELSGTVRGNPAGLPGNRVIKDVNATDLTGVRAELLIKPSKSLSITPMVFHQQIKQGGADTYDSVPGGLAHYQPLDVPESYKDTFTIASLTVNWDMGPASLMSATAYSNRKSRKVEDVSEVLQNRFSLPGFDTASGGMGAATASEDNPTRQFTQEVRVSSKGDGPLSWLVGGFYSRIRSSGDAASVVPGLADFAGTTNLFHQSLSDALTQKALFGSATYQFSPEIRLTTGLRRFSSKSDSKSVSSGLFSVTESDAVEVSTSNAKASGFNPMANLSYSPSNNQMFYLLAAKGFRDGAAQRSVPTTGRNAACAANLADLGLTASPVRYGPDTVWSYEAGSKSRLAGGAVLFNLAAYTQTWRKVQQIVGLDCGWGYTDNSGDARVSGMEYELAARLGGGFTVQHSLGYTRARFTADHAPTGTKKGDRLLNVPEWTSSLSLQYDQEISEAYSFHGRLDASYTGPSDTQGFTRKRLPGYTTLNLRAGIDADAWSLSLFVRNLTNRRVALALEPGLLANTPVLDRVTSNRPRTVGVEYSARF